MTHTDSAAALVLTRWGAKVTPIRTSNKDESDWLAEFGDYSVIVEEKTKLEREASRVNREATLARGEVHGSTLPLVYNNRLSGIVRKAAKQLDSTGADVLYNNRIVWFTGTGFDAEAKHFQFMATLYGSTKIFEVGGGGVSESQLRECYFFRNADFYRFRAQLDGSVVAYLHGDHVAAKLCLNSYSEGWQALRESPLALNFKLGLIDPIAEEAAGKAYIVDTDLPRSDLQAVLRYLEEKYSLQQAQRMDMNLVSAAGAMPP
jgi:hypothetical protein